MRWDIELAQWLLDVRDKIADILEEHKAKTQELDRAALEAEATALRTRLAEIEKLLGDKTDGRSTTLSSLS